MTPMLRGENGNPGNYELFLGEVDDARAAVKWLAGQPYVNPQRIYVFGHSVGGGVAAVLPLLDDVPMRHSGSSGGLYDHTTFLVWQIDDTVPFENNPMERSVRLLVGNSQFLQHPHYAYLVLTTTPSTRPESDCRKRPVPPENSRWKWSPAITTTALKKRSGGIWQSPNRTPRPDNPRPSFADRQQPTKKPRPTCLRPATVPYLLWRFAIPDSRFALVKTRPPPSPASPVSPSAG